jgi:hypothetical protein
MDIIYWILIKSIISTNIIYIYIYLEMVRQINLYKDI